MLVYMNLAKVAGILDLRPWTTFAVVGGTALMVTGTVAGFAWRYSAASPNLIRSFVSPDVAHRAARRFPFRSVA